MATNVFQELKRRKVVRVAVVYALVGFGVIEVAANTFPNLGVPDWGVTLVIALVILGFPLALVLSWMFDVTPEGLGLIERAREISEGAPWAELTRCVALQLAGREDEAAGVAADLVGRSGDEHISPYMISAALLQTGDAERALDYLEQALEDRDPVLPAIGGVPRWRPLHGNPRFDAVFQEVFPGREPPQRLLRKRA